VEERLIRIVNGILGAGL